MSHTTSLPSFLLLRPFALMGVSADVLCKSLLEAASDFSSGPLPDDIAILAIRRD